MLLVLGLAIANRQSAIGNAALSPQNSGFEEGLRGWQPDRPPGATAGDVSVLDRGAAEGKRCVRLACTADRPVVGLTSDPVPVPKGGAQIRLRFRYRTIGDPDELEVRVRPLDEKGQGLMPAESYRYAYLPLLAAAEWREASRGCLLVPEAVSYDVSFRIQGAGSLLVDAVEARVLSPEEVGVPSRGARIKGAHQDGVQVWYESPLRRVYRDTPAPAREADVVEIAAARGECEALQVVIVPKADAGRVRVRWQDFLGPAILPRELGRSAWVDYLEVKRTQAPFGRTGWVPDVLDPEDARDLKGGQVQPIWLTLKVPRDARPGLYNGAVQIESRPRDQWAAASLPALRIPIRLRVRSFALPEEPTLATLARIDQCPPQGREPLRRDLRDHRVTGEAFVGPLAVTVAHEGKVSVDFAAFDTAAADYFRSGLRLFEIAGPNPQPLPWPPSPLPAPREGEPGAWARRESEAPAEPSWNGLALESPEFSQAFASYVHQVATHLREKGWLSYAVLRLWERPVDGEQGDALRRLAALVRAAAPDLRILVAAVPEADLAESADIWSIPLPLGFRAAALRARGKAAFWAREDRLYALDPDCAAIDMRGYLWRLKRQGVAGVEWPAVTRWTQDGPPNPPELGGAWGGRLAALLPPAGWGVLIHPGRENVCVLRDSIRWEQYREGVEDYDALTLLEQAYASACRALQVQDARFDAADLIERVTRPVAPSIVESTLDPARLQNARSLVDGLIEFLSADPPCAVRFEGEGKGLALEGITLPAVEVLSGKARVTVDAAGRFSIPMPDGRLALTVRSGRKSRELTGVME